MKLRVISRIQKTLTYGIPCLLLFSLWYAVGATVEKEVVFIPYTLDDKEAIQSLREEGYLTNPLMYAAVSTAVELGFNIEPGGFVLSKFMGPFSLMAALASPEYKYISFYEGLRKEEVAEIVADKLAWNEDKKNLFARTDPICVGPGGEGYLLAGNYVVHKDEKPLQLRSRMEQEMFETLREIIATDEELEISSAHDVVTIASMIQREAAGKHDMNIISGVIQNRIDKNMPLQLDATLQYAKASEEEWWPLVYSEDKYIDSPFNTYQNKGLPPAPIASPGPAALAAAMNPIETACLFYLHDDNRVIHCASTYDEHKRNIERYLR